MNLLVLDCSKSSIEEISKYVVKDSDFTGSDWVSEFPQLHKALSHVRCLSPAGCWRDARRVLGFVDPDADLLMYQRVGKLRILSIFIISGCLRVSAFTSSCPASLFDLPG